MAEIEITQPQIKNIVCPQCKLTWMNKNAEGDFYFCYACSFTLFSKQVEK